MGLDNSGSRTPVLDRCVGLSRPSTDLTWRDGLILIALTVAGGFLVVAAFRSSALLQFAQKVHEYWRSFFGDGSGNWTPLLIPVAYLAVVIIHELGHAAAARIVGFKLHSLRIGPVMLAWAAEEPRLSFQRLYAAEGFVRVHDAGVRLRKKYAWFTAGGAAANLASVVAVAPLALLVGSAQGGAGKSALSNFMFLSVVTALVTVIPHRLGPFHSDGEQLRTVLCSLPRARAWLSFMGILGQIQRGIEASEWNAGWVRRASHTPASWLGALEGRWLGYCHALAKNDVEAAAEYLNECLAMSDRADHVFRAQLVLEAAEFQAWYRSDVAKAKAWLAEFLVMKGVKPSSVQAEIAIACAEGDFARARALWQKGAARLSALQDTPLMRRTRQEWAGWGTAIEAREQQANASTSASSVV